ncbi:methyltransferase domain-containing protein [Melioribacteraceae bacterium 4301-Me]|uniref:methyltransferase domain-containing protein n=1 Tax=Pyranulibacter aquaticus TaxID=3163344 RepID=UPI003598F64B
MLLKRSREKELMDNFGIEDERIDLALKEIAKVNKLLGGISVSRSALKILLKNHKKEVNLLDVGAGGCDIFLNGHYSTHIKLTTVDANLRSCRYLLSKTKSISIVCGDAKALPFKKKSFDVIHASLFLHHFADEEIIMLLKSFLELAKLGVIINDLHRSIFAYWGIKIISFLFSKSELFKNDAPLSVKRGFTKNELKTILNKIGKKYIINWRWAFRWRVVVEV